MKTAKKRPVAPATTEAPVTPAPAEAPVATEAKPAPKARYAKYEWKDEQVITVLVASNPKRGKSQARFGLHKTGQTVGDYVKASVDAGNPRMLARADLRWDVAHGLISIA